jgi:AcrR family transcriptional regulator
MGLFLEQGYAAVSLTRIAEVAGISRTTLFSYFRAKHELLWDEFETRRERLQESLSGDSERPIIDVIVDAIVAASTYEPEEHEGLRQRWRLVSEDAELRAYSTMRSEQLIDHVVEHVQRENPQEDGRVIERLVSALVGVASRCVEEWARTANPERSLSDHVAEGLRPFAERLGALCS